MRRGLPPVAVLAFGLLVLTAAALGGVARNPFIVYDDGSYLTENPIVRGGLSLRGVSWAFTTMHTGNWHPLTWLSHMLDVQLFGMRPGLHHLASLALHAVNSLLVLALLRALTGALWRPALVAALFAVHPLHVESVAWASERKDVLSTLFALTAMLAYVRAARRGAILRSAILPLSFAFALLAKAMPVTLPFLLLLLDWWPLGRWGPASGAPGRGSPHATFAFPPARLWLEKLPLFLLAMTGSAVTAIAQSRMGAVVEVGLLPLEVRAANAALSYVRYLGQTFWPTDLAVYYPHPFFLPPWWHWAGGVLLLAAATAIALRVARRVPAVPVGWFWYLGSLLPVIGLVQVGAQARADRYTYVPLIGIFVASAWAASELARDAARRRVLAGIAVAAIFLAGGAAARQVAVWRDGATLFRHALAVAGHGPDAAGADGGGNAMFRSLSGEPLVRNPTVALLYDALGQELDSHGRFEEAVALYRSAIRHDPGSVQARNNLGSDLLALGRAGEAVLPLREALAFNPRCLPALNNLGVALSAIDRPEEAERTFLRLIAIDAAYAPAHYNLGRVLLQRGMAREALPALREAVRLRPGHAESRALLAEAEGRSGVRAPLR